MERKEQLGKLHAYKPGKSIEEVRKELGLDEIIKLASNENPYGHSKKVTEAICGNASVFLYPDGAGRDLKEKIAEHIGVQVDQVMIGSGLDEVIQMVSRALLTPGDNIVQATPTFSQYSHHAIIEGAEVREIPLENGVHHLSAMLESIDTRTKIVWICNPNNPSGTYVSHEELIPFLNQVPASALVILDEAYYEYVVAEDYPQTLSFLDNYPNLMVMRTFSKAYGLAGVRIGYAVAEASFIESLEVARLPFNTSSIAQVAGVAALGDQEFIAECKRKNREGMYQYYDFCEELGLSYFPSEANFILIDIGIDSDEVFQYLMKKGYIVRSGAALGFPGMIRITIGTEKQNEGCISALRAFVLQSKAVR